VQTNPLKSRKYLLATILLATSAFASNPIPTVVGPVVPQAVVPGSGKFTLRVYGANFVSGAVVNWNRSPRSTTFISVRELQAEILAPDVASATAGYSTVTNPPPGGGVSSSGFGLVEVHTPTATIVAKRPHIYLQGGGPQFLLPTDFNNDGILDFAASWGSEIQVLLGNGDGTFRFGSFATHNYYSSSPIAYGDLNNDGNEDLVFGADQNEPTQLQVNLGDGNGKFRFGSRFWHFDTEALAIAVGDFNRDGNLDFVSTTAPFNLSVFLGEGDGGFKHWADYNQFVDTPFEVLTADFNGDGIVDLAALTQAGPYILIGNGDGTFEKPRRVISNDRVGSGFGTNMLVSDFNGDGKADLAYCERDLSANKGKIWIALGNGDGTFKKPVSLLVRAYGGVLSFAAGDFNSDGKTDLIANYFISNKFDKTETDLFHGNGNGTFQRKKVIKLPGLPDYNSENGILPTDFNSDGLLDFVSKAPGEIDIFIQK
jgi:hypothetical protein